MSIGSQYKKKNMLPLQTLKRPLSRLQELWTRENMRLECYRDMILQDDVFQIEFMYVKSLILNGRQCLPN